MSGLAAIDMIQRLEFGALCSADWIIGPKRGEKVVPRRWDDLYRAPPRSRLARRARRRVEVPRVANIPRAGPRGVLPHRDAGRLPRRGVYRVWTSTHPHRPRGPRPPAVAVWKGQPRLAEDLCRREGRWVEELLPRAELGSDRAGRGVSEDAEGVIDQGPARSRSIEQRNGPRIEVMCEVPSSRREVACRTGASVVLPAAPHQWVR